MGEPVRPIGAREFCQIVAEALGLQTTGLLTVEIDTSGQGAARVVATYCMPTEVAVRLLPERQLISDEQVWDAISAGLKLFRADPASPPAPAVPAAEAASPAADRPMSEGQR